ncbi:MAG: Rpn family recombination-promoting nuclease/putative transposase [Lachnospiraceae bacterium]|nr:Rpn family recombination-promoting nuclease/putative transposase [Lachnospiraceae bacterium]
MNPDNSIISIPSDTLSPSLQSAHGPLLYNMTNDYMFRAVLQTNNKVLRGLICSLLHLSEEEILSAEIINPIILGKSIENKEFHLDIHVRLNNHILINLEMQVADRRNWQNRSVIYLCRTFDQLNRGQDYNEVLPSIHIGFLDYTLFEESPEFYATYKLINVKNNTIYSDNLTLSVVNLSRIDLATEEDKKFQIDHWAKLFKATTWEEITMLASKNNYFNEASNTMIQLSAKDEICDRCRDRAEYDRTIRTYENTIDRTIRTYENTIAQTVNEYESTIAQTVNEYKNTIAQTVNEYENTISEKDARIQQLLAENERLKTIMKSHDANRS